MCAIFCCQEQNILLPTGAHKYIGATLGGPSHTHTRKVPCTRCWPCYDYFTSARPSQHSFAPLVQNTAAPTALLSLLKYSRSFSIFYIGSSRKKVSALNFQCGRIPYSHTLCYIVCICVVMSCVTARRYSNGTHTLARHDAH
jgi:hypothetical protein